MIEYFLLIFGIAIAGLIALYVFAPRILYNFVRDGIRRRGGMKLKSICVDGLNWPYLEGGPANAPPIVLIHGFGADKDNWSLYAPKLTREYRLIAPDLPGFGENDRSGDADYSIALQARRVVAFLDAMGIEKCHLGGNSMGGFIALRAALDFPERLRSLTLFNNAGVIGADESELQRDASQGTNPLATKSADDVKRLLAYIAYKPQPMPGAFRRLFFEDANRHAELLDGIFWSIAADGLQRPLNGRLDEIRLPTLIIWGRHDRLIDVSCATVLHEGIANSELLILEDAGHVPMIEKPAATAAKHVTFLAKH